jgi:phytanoyl-CoA hydroxylase
MFTPEEVAQFDRDGFIMGPQIYSRDEAEALRVRMHDILRGKRGGAESVRNLLGEASDRVVFQIVNAWEADDLFSAHMHNETLCALAAQLMKTDTVRVWHDQIQYKPSVVGGPTDWHQDHPYWPVIQPADLVSAWLALDDATEENGCMWMVPGSHLWGPHKNGTIGTDENFDPAPNLDELPGGLSITKVPCPVRRGQVMFHHCLTWHGSPCNHSEHGRPAIAVHYMPGHTRYEPTQNHIMKDRVEVEPGEILTGKYFPTVWENGPVAASA